MRQHGLAPHAGCGMVMTDGGGGVMRLTDLAVRPPRASFSDAGRLV
jgi:hypothetical protein